MACKPISVTVPIEMSEYIESNNLSASKIIQQALNQIMNPELLEEENPLYKKSVKDVNDLKGQLLNTFLRIDELQKKLIEQKDDMIDVQRLYMKAIGEETETPKTRQETHERPNEGL